jgi:hypothetical protein
MDNDHFNPPLSANPNPFFIGYHLVIGYLAMEAITMLLRTVNSGKPSISMGHRKTMAMLIITRG